MHYWTRSSFQLTANHHQFVWWDLLLIRKGMNWAKPIKIRHCFVTKRKLQHFCRENVDSTLWAKKMAYLRFELTPHFIPLWLRPTQTMPLELLQITQVIWLVQLILWVALIIWVIVDCPTQLICILEVYLLSWQFLHWYVDKWQFVYQHTNTKDRINFPQKIWPTHFQLSTFT